MLGGRITSHIEVEVHSGSVTARSRLRFSLSSMDALVSNKNVAADGKPYVGAMIEFRVGPDQMWVPSLSTRPEVSQTQCFPGARVLQAKLTGEA